MKFLAFGISLFMTLHTPLMGNDDIELSEKIIQKITACIPQCLIDNGGFSRESNDKIMCTYICTKIHTPRKIEEKLKMKKFSTINPINNDTSSN